jgi:hypothetical protein
MPWYVSFHLFGRVLNPSFGWVLNAKFSAWTFVPAAKIRTGGPTRRSESASSACLCPSWEQCGKRRANRDQALTTCADQTAPSNSADFRYFDAAAGFVRVKMLGM